MGIFGSYSLSVDLEFEHVMYRRNLKTTSFSLKQGTFLREGEVGDRIFHICIKHLHKINVYCIVTL